jgi:psiF repeat
MTQQDKMKACNIKAGDKKGDERKTFTSECLKADKKS